MAKDKKIIKVRKPAFWLYWLPGWLTRPYFKWKWHHTIDRKGLKGLKSPVLAIANHSSTIDIILCVHSLLPKRYNIVTGRDLFTWPQLKPFVTAFGCIPKSQCSIDLASMRTMKAAAEQGRNVLIYPEGKTSMDGKELSYLSPSIAKFIKFMDCDLVMVHSQGAYLTRPRYFKGFKRGKIETKAYVLLKREEVRSLSNKEIYEKVVEAMKYNDHIWQRENNIKFKSEEPAQNLTYIIYKCPKCGSEYELDNDGRILTCRECGNKVEYTEYGELVPIGDSKTFERVDLWYDYQKEAIREELKNADFAISKEVELLIEDNEVREFKLRGEGSLYIKDGIIGYSGTLDGERVEIKQNVNVMNTIVTKNKEGVDLMVDDVIYRFMFKEHKWSVKYCLIVEQNFAVRNGLVK